MGSDGGGESSRERLLNSRRAVKSLGSGRAVVIGPRIKSVDKKSGLMVLRRPSWSRMVLGDGRLDGPNCGQATMVVAGCPGSTLPAEPPSRPP
jgi:hypothetical protein